MTTDAIKPVIKIYLALAAVGVLALAAERLFFINICPVYSLIGIPCPSCGMTRAWISALRGDLRMALGYHPLFWIIPLLPFLAVDNKRFNKFAKTAAVVILVLFIVVWMVRMAAFFGVDKFLMLKVESIGFYL
ncbi:MAG: DUF2752 domain-containing protein [Defluviitaleaceae bacterium]|nr:DUF2752 domain-containing protein [Defluviitaleaceae bacterium]